MSKPVAAFLVWAQSRHLKISAGHTSCRSVALEQWGDGLAHLLQYGDLHGAAGHIHIRIFLADNSMYIEVGAGLIGPVALAVTTNCSIDFMRKPAAGVDLIGKARVLKLGGRWQLAM